MLSFFPLDVLDEIWDLIELVSEGFPTYVLPNIAQYRTWPFISWRFDNLHET